MNNDHDFSNDRRSDGRDPRDPLGLNSEPLASPAANDASGAAGPKPILDADSGREIITCPYSAWYDASSNLFMSYFWKALCDEGSVLNYFSIQDAQGQPTGYPAFVHLLSSPDMKVQGIHARSLDGQSIEPIGFAIATPVLHGSVTALSVRMILLDAWHGRDSITEACRRIVAAWFTEGTQSKPWLQHLICTVPSLDRRSTELLTSLGWRLSGSIPNASVFAGQSCDAGTWYYTRQDFNQFNARRAFGDWQLPGATTAAAVKEGN